MRKRMGNRFVAVWLSVMMLLQLMQSALVPVYAEETESEQEVPQEIVEGTNEGDVPEEVFEPEPSFEEPTPELDYEEPTPEPSYEEPEQSGENTEPEKSDEIQPGEEQTDPDILDVGGNDGDAEEQIPEPESDEGNPEAEPEVGEVITPENSEVPTEPIELEPDKAVEDAEENGEDGEEPEDPEDLEEPEENEPVSFELKDHITSLRVIEGTVVEDGFDIVKDGESFTTQINWVVDGKVNADDTFRYKLPLNYEAEQTTGDVVIESTGAVIGTYLIDTEGNLIITYNDTYTAEEMTAENSLKLFGKAFAAEENKSVVFTWANGSTTVNILKDEVVMQMFGLEEDESDEANDAGDIKDLKNYITSLEIEGDPASVADGEKVTVKFGWTIEGNIHEKTNTFTYQLPVNFKMDAASTGPIREGENGPAVGTYTVDTSGLVTITYNEDYNPGNQSTINYMEITGEAEYGSEDDGHEIKFEWRTGSKVIVVTNPGDFTVEKSAVKVYPNNTLSLNSVIEYTVEISSELGTGNEPFTITDTVTADSKFASGSTFTFDPSSFNLIDQDGKSISVTPSINGQTFTIEGVPALPANGYYKLTYNVNVHQAGNMGQTDRKVSNHVVVTSGGKSHDDDTEINYQMILNKYSVEYNNGTKKYRWGSTVRTDGMNLAGFTFTDTADMPLSFVEGKPQITIRAYRWDSESSENKDVAMSTQPVVNVSEDRKTFSFVFPEAPGATSWAIGYYTDVEGESGTSFVINNTSVITNGDSEWRSGAVGKGTIQGDTTVSKTGDGFGVPNENGIVPFRWTNTILYEDDVVIKDGNGVYSYSHSDKIEAASISYHNGEYTGLNSSIYKNDHYGIASEIYQRIVESLRITTKTESGQERVLTFAEANSEGTVEVIFYTGENVDGQKIANDDSTTHAKSFLVIIKGIKPSKVQYSYSTSFDTIHYADGTLWRMKNSLGAEAKWSSATQDYRRVTGQTGNEIHKQINLSTGIWTGADYTYNWDKNNGAEGTTPEARTLKFRLLASPAEGSDTLMVTDHLPEGLTLIAGSVQVGNYSRGNNKIATNWTNNANVTISYDETSRILSVSLENIGTSLKLQDDNNVVIEYEVSIDENFEDGANITETEEGYNATRVFTNVAQNGDKSDSLTVTINKKQTILEKIGGQVIENGASTNRIRYSVTINEHASDLLEGSDVLTLTDTMTSESLDFRLDPTSITLTLANGTVVDPLVVNIQQPETNGTMTKQVFTITVQDSTAYVLSYEYIAEKRSAANAPTSGEVTNTIALEGKAESSIDSPATGINVHVSSNRAALQVVKVDSVNNAKFLTATFDVEKYNGSTYEKVESVTLSGDSGYLFDYYSQNCKLEGNTLYRLVETVAPAGYEKSDEHFYFIIKGNVQDVRSGSIAITNLVISTDEEALAAAKVPSGVNVNLLNPNSGSYFEIGNVKIPSAVSVTLEGTKTMSGKNLEGNDFTFQVKEGNEVVATGTNDATGKISFGTITYKKEHVGTHTYVVSEVNDGQDGVVYDTKKFTVIVKVTEDENEDLHTEVTYPDGSITFGNSYGAEGDITLNANKILTGRTLGAEEFSFTVKEGETVVATGKNAADGTITFDKISYELKDIGTHTYTITEDAGTVPGVTYDSNSIELKVEVTNNGDGTLSAQAAYPTGGVSFANTYSAKGEITLTGNKTLEGRYLKDGEFTFSVKEGEAVVTTGKNAADGTISFDKITYTQDDVGEHIYTITEDAGNLPGVKYDGESYNVKVTVTDNGDGTLDAVLNDPSVEISFANTYAAEGVLVLEGTKSLTGRTLEVEEFTFTVKEGEKDVATGKNEASGDITFTEIKYTLSDVGMHTYTVTEDDGSLGGVTYDKNSFEVIVEVSDGGDGKLNVTATYPDNGVAFTNVYEAEGKVSLEASKELDGRELNNEEFFFTVKEGEKDVATGKNDATGEITFTEIKYTLSDVGTHTYTVTEDDGSLGGVTYDKNSFEVTVEVSDGGDGELNVTATYPEEGIVFTNVYEAEGEAKLTAMKKLEGRKLNAQEFSFTVTENGEVVVTGKSDEVGKVVFPAIQYTLEDVGTHIYTITEDAGNLGGITYDTSSIEVTVKVSDRGDGTLDVEVGYPSEDGSVFTNIYEAEGEVQLEALKKLEGRELNDQEFTFTVTEDGKAVVTAGNDKDGKINFPVIQYTLDDVGTHKYTITEDSGNLGGITYDTSSIEVMVKVSDNGDGTLNAEVTYPDENGAVFVNKYDTKSAYLNLEGTKELTGRELKDGEFEFTITENDKVVATGKNDKDGKISFTEIEYKLEDVGTHILTVTEVTGDKGGVDYSKESYVVTVTVSDNGDGTLSVEVTKPASGIVFHNGYSATEVVVSLGAKKKFPGGTLRDGLFSFVLKDEAGNTIEIVQNTADGTITFGVLRFTEVGEYFYTISEIAGTDNKVRYDRSVFKVQISVKDDGEGKLTAVVDTEGKNLIFVNSVAPAIPNTSVSGNCTRTNLLFNVPVLAMIASVLARFMKKRNEE